MLKKAYDLSKYIMTMLFMLLPTPIYMCLENESFQKIETTNWVTVAAISLYLLLTLFIVLVADNVKYWVISGMLTTLLLCVGCMIDPFFYKSLVVPSLPFAEGNLMTDELFGWELPPVLLTIIWGAEKIVFGALYMIVYKLVNKLKNRQYVLKLKKEFKIIVIASIISILLVAICFTYDYIVTGEVFSLKDVFSTILLPFAFLIYMVLIIATYHPFQLVLTKVLLDLTEGLNVVTMSAIAFVSSFFNVEGMYQAQSTLPYVTSVITEKSLYPLIGVIFNSIYGIAMLVLPSSAILMGTLEYLGVSYVFYSKKECVEINLVDLVNQKTT